MCCEGGEQVMNIDPCCVKEQVMSANTAGVDAVQKKNVRPIDRKLNRRNVLFAGTTLAAASAMGSAAPFQTAPAQAQPAPGRPPNILVIFRDDIRQSNISAYTFGLMGYMTPNIDRIAREGMMFTDY